MKIGMLVLSLIGLSFVSITRADQLPQMGYDPRVTVQDLVAKGYRWVTVNGPYACASEQELRKISSDRSHLAQLRALEDGGAYYLLPGTLVRKVQDDHASGMSEIRLGGIIKPRWTYTKFLSAHPIHDIYGIVETPDTAGLIDPSDTARIDLIQAGPTPEQRVPMTQQALPPAIKAR
jgi:hypothetical protein